MTKMRALVGLVILGLLGYAALFVADRWNADVAGTIEAIEGGLQHPVIGTYDLVKVKTEQKSKDNPTGEVVLILTAKTNILEQNYWRTRNPVYDAVLKPGQKIVATYSSLLTIPTLPPQRTASEVVVLKW